MTATLAEFHAKFQVDELEVLHTAHWTWSVRPAQPTLGAGILSLNRFATSLGELTSAEAADLSVAVPMIEATLRRTYAPGKLNYLMLMMVDAHVHFHVLARYDAPRLEHGQEWVDSDWPGPPDLAGDINQGGPATLAMIRDSLRRHLA